MSTVKERPTLFSGPMVRANLRQIDPKTQTRRVVKMCKQFAAWDSSPAHAYDVMMTDDQSGANFLCAGDHGYTDIVLCPYGKPGDRLWVRETWTPDPPNDGTWSYTTFMGCRNPRPPLSDIPSRFQKPQHVIHRASWNGADLTDWRPSIHMPRWASRLTLEIVTIRVERLQDISEKDAIAEGLARITKDNGQTWKYGIADMDGLPGTDNTGWDWKLWEINPVKAYAKLWDAINGKPAKGKPDISWKANPYVWVIEYKRVEGVK